MKLIEIMIHEQNWEIVSSVSAQKLECPSSARLGSGPFQLGSAQEISARTHHHKKRTLRHKNKPKGTVLKLVGSRFAKQNKPKQWASYIFGKILSIPTASVVRMVA